jgi:hypothetical protein
MKNTFLKRIALTTVATLTLGLVGFAPGAKADWNPGDPFKMHYPQLPDLTPTGLDVLATFGTPLGSKVLADDFMCTQTGPITDIHIWGSWLNDMVAPNAVFHLSIHADIPAGAGPFPYSTPGPTLWSMDLNPSQQRLYATAPEQFYNPNTGTMLGADTMVYQYNFYIPQALAFQQQQGTIYWLDVQCMTADPGLLFGWKTSGSPHFMDDAVWGDNLMLGGEPQFWEELIDPTGQSRDLAFVITTPEPSTLTLTALAVAALVIFRRRR